ncbi:MAG: GAF domain-containing protein [Actinobacteria bacterium]|nr:MAG: GAF domain-containing protein [Actinomycetota bacterium]
MNGISEQALDALAAAGRRAADERNLGEALRGLGEAAAQATGADVAVIRVADEAGLLAARAIVARSEALGAELEGSSFPVADLPPGEAVSGNELPEAVRRAAKRARAADALILPARVDGKPIGSLELLRGRRPFAPEEIVVARLAASHLGVLLRAFQEPNGAQAGGPLLGRALTLAGDALAVGLDQARAAGEVARIAAGAAGAEAVLLWQAGDEGALELLASAGPLETFAEAGQVARSAFAEREPVRIEPESGGLGRPVATLTLGQPPVGVLQLVFPDGAAPSAADVDRLATFAVRAAQALRAGERTREMSLELEQTQALLAVVSQAIAELSLSHTLETAVARVSELLGSDRVAVYLREGARLRQEAGTSRSAAAELAVAERLLELAFGPLRAQGMLHVSDAQADLRLASVRRSVQEAGIEAALAVPLVAREELIGVLAAYLPRSRELSQNEASLLTALASQVAVVVENAKLHERTERLAVKLDEALSSERETAKRDGALYEISRSFAQSLSLDATLEAVTRVAVELLGADAGVIRMQDERGDLLVPRASHVADPRLADPLRPLVTRDQAVAKLPGRRLFRMGKPLILDAGSARRLGSSYELLAPFLEQGATAIVVPIATPAELLATLTVVSLDPRRRLGAAETETALVVAGQAALAIDNARLYQQQKAFADTMQRSLLPRGLPEIDGLEVGAVYESSARVEVGGDVYDFLPLPDGRLAVVLGDVSGHGIAASADMALAKFTFRSLVRQYPDPGELLAQVNEVALGELSSGSFVTMLCVTVDPASGEVRAASAGHPASRLLAPDGSVSALAPRGLALGVEEGQRYEELQATLAPGSALCLYTDGLVEARRDGDLYGDERLDASLSSGRELSASELAEHVVAECRAFAGEPEDDYAVVVIRRL